MPTSLPNVPCKKTIWAQWDESWSDIPRPQRLTILTNATAPGFTYTNMTHAVSGDLDMLVDLIEEIRALQLQGGQLTVKHKGWWEQHGQSALEWDMVDLQGRAVIAGWSHAVYGADGRLVSVSDFYDADVHRVGER